VYVSHPLVRVADSPGAGLCARCAGPPPAQWERWTRNHNPKALDYERVRSTPIPARSHGQTLAALCSTSTDGFRGPNTVELGLRGVQLAPSRGSKGPDAVCLRRRGPPGSHGRRGAQVRAFPLAPAELGDALTKAVLPYEDECWPHARRSATC